MSSVSSVMSRFQNLCDPIDQRREDDEVTNLFRSLCLQKPEELQPVLQSDRTITSKKDSDGKSLLHHLARNTTPKHPSPLVDVAIKHGASISSHDKNNQTPLHATIKHLRGNRYLALETLPMLLTELDKLPNKEKKELLQTRDAKGNTLLHYASKSFYTDRIDGGWIAGYISSLDILIEILKKCMEPEECTGVINVKNNKGLTALDYALCEKYKAGIRILVENGATYKKDLNEAEKSFQQAHQKLNPSLSSDQIKKIKEELSELDIDKKIAYMHEIAKYKADKSLIKEIVLSEITKLSDEELTHQSSVDGYTLLHVMALLGEDKMTATLLQKGVNPVVKNTKGLTAIDIAALNGQSAVYKQLLDYSTLLPIEPSTCPPIIQRLDYDTSPLIVQDIIERCAFKNVNEQLTWIDEQENKTTLLQAAHQTGRFGWMLFLLANGADIKQLFPES